MNNLLLVTFIALKVLHIVSWSWLVVLIPLWIDIFLAVIGLIIWLVSVFKVMKG